MSRILNPWAPEHRQFLVPQEPISTAIGLTSLLIEAGLGAGIAGTIGGGLVGAAALAGLSYAAQGLMPRGQQSSLGANAPEIRYSTRQSVPGKRILYGEEVNCGGALCFEKVNGSKLVQMFMVCAEEIEGFKAIYIGTNKLSFPAGIVENTILTPSNVDGQPDYAGNLRLCVRLGTSDQEICPLLADNFGNLEATFRQRDIATITLEYNYGADYDEFQALWGQNRYPNAFWTCGGVRIYDGRMVGQLVDDRTTWGFVNKDNSSLVQADFLRKWYGGRISSSRIDWDKVFEAADYDDGLIGTNEGIFLKRHTINGVVSLQQSPAEVLAAMLSSNRGFALQGGGKVWVSSSKPRTSVLTITDKMLTGGIEYRASKPKRDLMNSVKTRFVASERQYELIEGPTLTRDDLETADGEPLPGTLSLPFTLDHRRVQRLQKAYLDSSRLGKTVNVAISLADLTRAKEELIGEPIVIESDLFPQANGTYQVLTTAMSEDYSSVEISAQEYDAAIESDFIPEDDEQEFVETELDVS